MTIAPTETIDPPRRPLVVPPSTMHRSLLRAALWQEQPALEAWQQWRDSVDIETLDPESHHLLSTLYPNLLRHGVEDVQMSRLKGVHRRTWYVNQLLASSFASVLQTLQDSGISPLVLGEMALAATVYPDYGHRPIYQLDLFVPWDQTLAAIDSLQRLGWTNSYRPQAGERFWKNPLVLGCTKETKDALSVPLYLHNHLFQAAPQSYTDRQLWTNATAAEISNFPTLVLNPVEQLLHLCLKNNRQGQKRPIYWLADAAMLVNSLSQEADWVELVTKAQHYEIILPLRYLLKELQEVLNLAPPDWVMPSLQRMAISYHELLEYHLASDRKLLLLKAQLMRLRQRWRELLAGDKNR
jgi:hypothetical protein